MNLNEAELGLILEQATPLVGLKLTEALYFSKNLILGFFKENTTYWLWLDLSPQSTLIMPLAELPMRVKSEKKPIILFLKSHFMHKKLLSIDRLEGYGRVVELQFEDDSLIQLRLFPMDRNILVKTKTKQISLNKLKQLVPLSGGHLFENIQDFNSIKTEWLELKTKKTQNVDKKEALLSKQIQKCKKNLTMAEQAKSKILQISWKKTAEALHASSDLNLAEKFDAFLDRKQSLAWNINNAFNKHKAQMKKLPALESRIEGLKTELDRLSSGEIKIKPTVKPALLEEAQIKGRRLKMDEGVFISIGKNAKDNMALLRKAKAWHVWLHLTDLASAHGIIECPRKYRLTTAQLKKAAQFMLENSMKKDKRIGNWGVIYTECRYIRPIKGAKPGLVNYQNEKSFIVTCSA